jgi:hypothetical protein
MFGKCIPNNELNLVIPSTTPGHNRPTMLAQALVHWLLQNLNAKTSHQINGKRILYHIITVFVKIDPFCNA